MKIQNYKYKILIILIIIIFSAVGIYFYCDYKITQENVKEVEIILAKNNFSNFYQKQGNIFCSNVEGKFEQENIINDMLWVLENQEIDDINIQKIQCKNKTWGILIK